MEYTVGKYLIVKKITQAKEVYDFTILCNDIAEKAEAGQFVQIYVEGHTLRRPVSICEIDKENGTIRLVFEVRGKGTKELSALNEGNFMDLLGPLGNGFKEKNYKSIIVVGGGIGTPPMLMPSKLFKENCTVITGFRSAENVILQKDFQKTGAKVILCTDDGSIGRKGFVTEALREEIKLKKPDAIFCCGPQAMIKGVVDIADENNIPCQISLEERMGCGIGACLVCACRLIKDGKEFYGHVCKDGPVFDSSEVIL